MHYIITLCIIGTAYLISISTDCLGVVLELNVSIPDVDFYSYYNAYTIQGVLAAVPLAYVLPALSYLQLEEGFILSRKKIPALAVVMFGLTVAILGALFLFVDFDEVDTCSHGKIMPYCVNATVHNYSLAV